MGNARLIGTTVAQVTVFFLIFGTFIFLPAGTLNFPQGWIFFAVFCVSTSFVTAFFLIKDPALIARRVDSAETRTEQKLFQTVSGTLFFVGLLVIPGLDQRFAWSSVPFVVSLVANIFTLMGFAIVFIVFRTNSYTSATIGVIEGQNVVTTGVYALVRHPMYFGAVLILVSMPLALDSLWALIPSGLICVFIVLRLLDEEKVLLKELPGYEEYCRTTKCHLIPFIW